LAKEQLARTSQAGQVLNPLLLETAQVHPDYLMQNLLVEDRDAQQAWAKNQVILRRIYALAKQHKARILLTIFPSTIQVNDSHFEFYRRLGFRLDERTLRESKPQDLLNKLCQDEGWDCLDLLPVFRREGQNRGLYLLDDDHWDPDGNALAFREMASVIDRRGWLQ
jgi:predicted DCC family thiol-disulfide oxidoreductase YuxK